MTRVGRVKHKSATFIADWPLERLVIDHFALRWLGIETAKPYDTGTLRT